MASPYPRPPFAAMYARGPHCRCYHAVPHRVWLPTQRFCEAHAAAAEGRCWDHRNDSTWPPDDSPKRLMATLREREASRARAAAARQAELDRQAARDAAAAVVRESLAPPDSSPSPVQEVVARHQPPLRRPGSAAASTRTRRPSLTVRSRTFKMMLPSPSPKHGSTALLSGGDVVPFQYPSRVISRNLTTAFDGTHSNRTLDTGSVLACCTMMAAGRWLTCCIPV